MPTILLVAYRALMSKARRSRAGRIMLDRVQELAGRRVDFAFETTLASRSFAPRIADLRKTGYRFGLVFLWLPSPDYAIARVAERVRRGGHNIPEETIRRRYFAGLRNFFELYQPMADTWLCLDNHAGFDTKPIAAGRGTIEVTVFDEPVWRAMKEAAQRG